MILSGIAHPDSKFFFKSEWGLASDDWPAVSFSKRAVGRKMRGIYDPTRDFVIYVGTTNARNTLTLLTAAAFCRWCGWT
jgi:hypothetical protein